MASGRLLVLPPGDGLYLFTGETPATSQTADMTVGRLALSGRSDGPLALTYDGPLLRFADRTPFLDLEAGLAGARVAEASLQLDLSPLEGARAHVGDNQPPFTLPGGFALITGSLRVSPPGAPGKQTALPEASSSAIIGSGFIERRGAPSREGARVIATVPGHPAGALRLLWRQGEAPRVHLRGAPSGFALPADSVHVRGDRSGNSGPLLELPAPWSRTPGATLRTTRERRVPIVRQGAGGRVIEYLLAFCEFESAGEPAGAGWVEVST